MIRASVEARLPSRALQKCSPRIKARRIAANIAKLPELLKKPER
jgi:hypothetical protein